MQLSRRFYALILLSQGFKKEALEILKNLRDKKATEEYRIFSSNFHIQNLKNHEKFEQFDNISEENRYEFEKWLLIKD